MSRPRLLISIACSAALIFVAAAGPASAGQPWQLLFHYDSTSLELVEAAPIVSLGKTVRTPGLVGAPVRLAYELTWYDAQSKSLAISDCELPLGIRSTLGDNEPCRMVMPDEGYVLVRLDGPPHSVDPASVLMTRGKASGRGLTTLEIPPPFRQARQTLPVSSVKRLTSKLDGPWDVKQIRYTGPDSNRLVVVIMGDGYTADNLIAGEFDTDVLGLQDEFLDKAPWDILFDGTNLYQVDVESNEEGADHEVYGVLKDTYLHSSFWINGIERLLGLSSFGQSRAYQIADRKVGVGVWDILLVLVNSTKYGGSGGSIAVSSVNAASGEIVLHELGHSVAGLADEYEDPYPGYPPGDGEPNVDYDYDGPGLKWNLWVEAGTPLPTPEAPEYAGVVGSFEGARYLSSGIYRPKLTCQMRALGNQFCPVCREAHLKEYLNLVGLIDLLTPTTDALFYLDYAGNTFAVDPWPVADLQYDWYLNGDSIAGAHDTSYFLHPSQLVDSLNDLSVTATFSTDLVRGEVFTETHIWHVAKLYNCCLGDRGNVDNDPLDAVSLGDLTVLIDFLFVSFEDLDCWLEANVDESQPEGEGSVSLGDLTVLIDHLFVSFQNLPPCP